MEYDQMINQAAKALVDLNPVLDRVDYSRDFQGKGDLQEKAGKYHEVTQNEDYIRAMLRKLIPEEFLKVYNDCRELANKYDLPNKNEFITGGSVEVPQGKISIASERDVPAVDAIVPAGFYNKYIAKSMEDFWAEGEIGVDTTATITTKCSEFLPILVKAFSDQGYNDIFPNGKVSAQALTESFKKNMHMEQIAPGKTAEEKANAAQKLANEGYLVLAGIDGGSHVAAVGPQSLNYGSYPPKAWAGNQGAYQTGNGYGGSGEGRPNEVLYQYPVFVQAGSYTGVVNPGNAMGRSPFKDNTVIYFMYKPRH